jgi:hypothetical protein
MSKNALKKIGIGTFDDFTPTKGVIVDLPKDQYARVKAEIVPYITSLGDAGFWLAGGGGSFDPEHPDAKEGHTTTKIVSGDLDVFMDADLIRKKLGLDPKITEKDVKLAVGDRVQKQHPMTIGADAVHLAWPAPGETKGMPNYYQIDLMIKDHAHRVGMHHTHSYRHKNSPYKGVDQQLAMASLVNSIPSHPEKTFQYHGLGGKIQDRASKEVQSNDKIPITDIEHAAQLALGPGATWRNISSVEDIIDWFGKEGLNHPRLSQLKADLERKKEEMAKKKLKEGTADWFRHISQNLGV